MTENQTEKLRQKIKQIKLALAADKRRAGGFYDDSRGLRYMPPRFYIKLGDFDGGLKYVKWFYKNFPDDAGFPDFLFECTVIIFKTNNLRSAEKKAFETYCSNTYIFDKFFDRQIIPIDKYEYSNTDIPEFADYLKYSCKQTDLVDFGKWLENFSQTEKFARASQEFIEIHKRLNIEKDTESRRQLIRQARLLGE